MSTSSQQNETRPTSRGRAFPLRGRNGASHRPCAVTVNAKTPAASAVPLTVLDKIDAELKGVTDRIVEMIGELSQ